MYRRVYFGYDDSDVIVDEMSGCQICKYDTKSICARCHSTVCDNHSRPCAACPKILCEPCSHTCVDCRKNFCDEHKPPSVCGTCRSILCQDCSSVRCTECKTPTCSRHREKCIQCKNHSCVTHAISKKYALITKSFCSQLCLNGFDENYRSSGMFGRLVKIMK